MCVLPQHLKGIIASLRAELDALQSELGRGGTGRYVGSSGSREGGGAGAQGGVELRRLRDENTALRQQVRMLERAGAGRGGDGDTERMTAETREMTRELKMVSSCPRTHTHSVRYDLCATMHGYS